MIRGIHGLFYSTDPAATRAFFRDKVKLPGCDVGEGWLIFDLPEGDLGVHPVEDPDDAGMHNVSFYCDDIQSTVRDLKSRGVKFTTGIADHGYGLVTYFRAPGGILVQLYEPRYVKTKRSAARGVGSKRARGKKAAAKRGASRKQAPRRARTAK
jgi:catechol 2,3-dioxygenase-like lactoylglutathione lyase family enzyme